MEADYSPFGERARLPFSIQGNRGLWHKGRATMRREAENAGSGDHLGLDGVRGALASCHYRNGVDRLVLLFRGSRPRLAAGRWPAARRAWRGVAGAWRRILSYPQVPGGTRGHARASDLVQMGELRHVAVGRGAVDDRLLGGGRIVPHRPEQGRSGAVAGDRDLRAVADRGLAGL